MKLRSVSLAPWVLALAACSSSSHPTKAGMAADAGHDAAMDASEPGPEPRGVQVTNPGEACDSNADCEGPSATCMTSFGPPPGVSTGGQGMMSVSFPDGYCTASCTTTGECGAGSECGVSELINRLRPILQAMGNNLANIPSDQIPSQCLLACRETANCRRGYVCQTLLDALGVANGLPTGFLLSKYCLPDRSVPTDMDAGHERPMDASEPPATDASTSTDAGSHPDASPGGTTNDGGASDAGSSDAGAAPHDAGA